MLLSKSEEKKGHKKEVESLGTNKKPIVNARYQTPLRGKPRRCQGNKVGIQELIC
jgi:hypothetical protein